jgi:cystathionine beta-lyase/cystathionine gamma-synthase
LNKSAERGTRARPWGVATRCVQGELEFAGGLRARRAAAGAPIEAAQARLAALEGAAHARLHADAPRAARALLGASCAGQSTRALALSPRVGEPWRGALRGAARELGLRTLVWDERLPEPAALAPRTLLVCAALGEARLELCDVPELARRARAAGAQLALCADPHGPLVQTPLALGAQASLHAPLAGLAGRAGLGGAAIACGPELELGTPRARGTVRADAALRELAYALLAGLPSLGLRAAAQAASASVLAQFLTAHPRVAAVHHPSLESHPDRALAGRVLRAHSARVAFELVPGFEARALLARSALFERQRGNAGATGGARSALRARPVARSPSVRRGASTPAALELWAGLEDDLDLIDALMAALESLD